MKTKLFLLAIMLIVLVSGKLFAQDKDEVLPAYTGSRITYDNNLGFNVFYICTGKLHDDTAKIEQVEGYIRHRFCYAPSGRSAYEIIKNFEEAVIQKEGKVYPITQNSKCVKAFMKKGHPWQKSQTYEYMQIRNYGGKYFSGKISTDEHDYYIAVVVGNIDGKIVYSLVTIKVKAMDRGMVTIGNLEEGLSDKGHIAIYNIFFDTGKYDIKAQSNEALKTIAEYMKAHADKNYYVVGHTDNVGDYEMNIQLSTDRAKAVAYSLVSDHGVNTKQLKAYGVGPLSPVKSNKDDKGKTKNRRVEIVEQ